jgi:hypothetical protein
MLSDRRRASCFAASSSYLRSRSFALFFDSRLSLFCLYRGPRGIAGAKRRINTSGVGVGEGAAVSSETLGRVAARAALTSISKKSFGLQIQNTNPKKNRLACKSKTQILKKTFGLQIQNTNPKNRLTCNPKNRAPCPWGRWPGLRWAGGWESLWISGVGTPVHKRARQPSSPAPTQGFGTRHTRWTRARATRAGSENSLRESKL